MHTVVGLYIGIVVLSQNWLNYQHKRLARDARARKFLRNEFCRFAKQTEKELRLCRFRKMFKHATKKKYYFAVMLP